MKISELYRQNRTVLSFEVFPPKKEDGIETVYDTVAKLSVLKPDFISVTYGAGGGAAEKRLTADIAQRIKDKHGAEALAHLTCVGTSAGEINRIAEDLKGRGIENVLALKGDNTNGGGFPYAKDLIAELKKYGFCIGAAAYPEAHIACESVELDIERMKQKQDAGAEFFVTQLFFANDIFYRFMDRARAAGVTAPVSAGIMPILSKLQVQRMIFMCGASLPSPVIKMINRYGDEGESLLKAGVEYSYGQMRDLCTRGAQGIHIYTMNKPFIAEYCTGRLMADGLIK